MVKRKKRNIMYEDDVDAAEAVTFEDVTIIGKGGRTKTIRMKVPLFPKEPAGMGPTERTEASSSSASTRKSSAKRARSPEPAIPADPDVAPPKSKRSKQTKESPLTVEKGKTTGKSRTKKVTRTQAAPQPTATPVLEVDESHPPEPTYIGNFDLHDMDLPYLPKTSLRKEKGDLTQQYEQIYNTIISHQSKDETTAQFFLASPMAGIASYLRSSVIMDPMIEYPFEIVIGSFKHHSFLPLPSDKYSSDDPGLDSPGISAKTSLGGGQCGIKSASGEFKLKRVWTRAKAAAAIVSPNNEEEEGEEFVELFAGYFTFNVSYGGMYKSAGQGTGQRHKWGFWAVRARTGDDGKEVGLEPMLPVSVRRNAGDESGSAATAGSAAQSRLEGLNFKADT